MSALDDAIRGQADGPIVTTWIVVAEIIRDNGARAIEIVHDAESTPWARLGMLQTATARTHTRITGGQQ